MANALGTEEPIYGPEAIQPVTRQGVEYTELTKNDLKWKQRGGTNVETQTFYFTAASGHVGVAQIIYSGMSIRDQYPFPEMHHLQFSQ